MSDEESYTESCFLCKKNPKLEKKIQHVATRNAHKLAIREADKGHEVLSWAELYAAQFPKIYKHEQDRHYTFLNEMDLDTQLKEMKQQFQKKDNLTKRDHPQQTCSQHSENVGWFGDGFHDEVQKKVRRKYAESKWPKKSSEQ